jgi:hypothetical protein
MAWPVGDAIGRTSSSHHCLTVVVRIDVINGMPLGGNTGIRNNHLLTL